MHAAFREVAPFMFKSGFNNDGFIFGWLKKRFVESFCKEGSDAISKTEQRIRILKTIARINPDAVLNIKINPRAKVYDRTKVFI